MCTVTWLRGGSEYHLFCNRDEKRSRAKALSPRVCSRNGVRFIAPLDGDFGGTWIATNEFGLSLALVNGANITGVAGVSPISTRSRGLLLLDLIPLQSAFGVAEQLREMNLAAYAPFTVAAIELNKPAALVEWNGVLKNFVLSGEPHYMLTSSSYDSDCVRRRRKAEYLRLAKPLTPQKLLAFHGSHQGGPSAFSTCMHRSDAETVSFSRIHATRHHVEFVYFAGSPCSEDNVSSTLRIERSTCSTEPHQAEAGVLREA